MRSPFWNRIEVVYLSLMISGSTPARARHYVSYTPIVDFKIDPAGGHSFSVLVRRQRGPTLVFLIVTTVFTLSILILFFYHPLATAQPNTAAVASHGHAARATGMPGFAVPLLVVFAILMLWNLLRGDKAQLAGLGGNERWSFTQNSVDPPTDITGTELPDLLAGTGHLRATVDLIGGKWVIDFSAEDRNLYLGPFQSEALAGRCEAELRQRLPRWFTEPAGTVLLNAVPDGYRAVHGVPPEPIVSIRPVAVDGDDVQLQLQRSRGPRPPVAFITLWLCFWLASVVVIGWMILNAMIGGPLPKGPHLDGSISEKIFLVFFIPLWTAGGLFAFGYLTLCLRRDETWTFTAAEIVTGRNWQHLSIRRLPIEQTVQVRFGPFADPPSVDFISGGKLLHLGPFATWDLAGEAMGDLERRFSRWQWPSQPGAGTGGG